MENEEQRDKLIYIRNYNKASIGDKNIDNVLNRGEPLKIAYELSPDNGIWEFKRICRRLAYSLGYGHDSIMEAFPFNPLEHESFDELMDEEFKDILPSLRNIDTSPGSLIPKDWKKDIESEINDILNEDDDIDS